MRAGVRGAGGGGGSDGGGAGGEEVEVGSSTEGRGVRRKERKGERGEGKKGVKKGRERYPLPSSVT